MEQKPLLIDSLMVYQMSVPVDGKVISVKVTVKNFEPVRIEPSVSNNDDLMLFMRLTSDAKNTINKYISEHIDTFKGSL